MEHIVPYIQISFIFLIHNKSFLNCSETIKVIITCGEILKIYVGKPAHNPPTPDYLAVTAIAWKIFLYCNDPSGSGFCA